jgi:hypothetical protein
MSPLSQLVQAHSRPNTGNSSVPRPLFAPEEFPVSVTEALEGLVGGDSSTPEVRLTSKIDV